MKLIVTIRSVFVCLNYVINTFVKLLILPSNLARSKAFPHENDKRQMPYQFITQKEKTTGRV